MARIILEDMKLNKTRRQVIPKKEIDLSPSQIREEIERQEAILHEKEQQLKKVEIKEEYIEEQKEKLEEIKNNIKIDKYINNKRNTEQRLSSTPMLPAKHRIIHRPVIVIFIICLFLGGVYWAGNVFEKANINITSKHELIKYKDKQFTAGKDESGNNVNFEIMITPNKKSVNITLTEPKEVSIKSTGSITLYNEYSTKAEKISAGTFVSDSEGKTYKTNSTVSIPGYKTINKKVVPGQVTVNITSFLPGEAYNGSPTDFFINSFKNTTKYKKIYGKLKSPLVGGASGIVYTLDEKSKKNIDNIANTSLKSDLLAQVKTLVPPGYIIYEGAINFSYEDISNLLSKTPEASVDINGILSVVLIKEESLRNNIIKASLPNIKGDELKEIKISDLDKLSFNFSDKNQIITKDTKSLPFALSGDIDVVWVPDMDILKNKLLGVYKDDVLPIFRQDPGISSAMVKIFPPWQKSIPNDVLKIDINIQ